ncbi:efflux RND transporter permease subunit [Exilibacterium tricleocarpae]|nr:efflux RND transporter permease subunit [Exilibacterium tricleocarpae]
MRLIENALIRSRTVLAVLLLLLVTGTLSYITIPKEAAPDVDIPINYVLMRLDGISPEDAERLLVRPMEEELQRVEGVKEMTAAAYEGGGHVVLEFDAGFDADQALEDVREAVDKVEPDLPPAVDKPTVHEINTSLFPILAVTLSGPVPERTLVRLARELQDDIEAIPSVLNVDIGGDREETVEIIIDPLLVESYGLNGGEVATLLGRSNRLVAAGNIDTGLGRFSVKVPGVFENLEDILNMPVQVRGDAAVRFRDIARVYRTFKDRDGYARLDGEPAVVLEVSKRTGENIIDTVDRVRAVVDAASAEWRGPIRVSYHQDSSTFVKDMLKDLENHVLAAVLLVMMVIVGVLGLRSAVLVGISIPGSFLTAILVLSLLDLTVNMVVLFALILAIGVLVDAAIIVVEYADRRMAEGRDSRAAYIEAAKRMAWPVIAATATTLAAFLPMLFWPGVVGEFMRYFPITVLAAMTASLFMALLFVPTLGAFIGKTGAVSQAQMRTLAAAEDGRLEVITGFAGLYLKGLRAALAHPGKLLLGALLILILAWSAYGHYGRGVEYFPTVEPDFAAVLVHARGNLAVDEQDALVGKVERQILTLSDEMKGVYTRSGAGVVGAGTDVAEDVIGQITLEFGHWEQRRKAAQILADVRALTAAIPGVRVQIREQEPGPPIGKPIQVQLASAAPELLPAAVAEVRQFLETLPGVVDIEDDLPVPGIQWELSIDRAQAAKFNLDLTAVGDATKLVTTGLEVGTYRPDDSDDELDILVRYPPAQRTVEQLDKVRVVTAQGAVPVSNFVTRTPQPKVSTLHRADGERVMTVRADVAAGVLVDDTMQHIKRWVARDADLDSRIAVSFKGEDEEQREAQGFLLQAFAIALFIMAIILVTQFNNFYNAALILSAVVLSTVGALLGLLVTDQAFSTVVTGTGMIALAGVVVNDNIVLIDTFDRLKQRYASTSEAILRTGVARLRPVILTTVTTALGLMPMLLGMNIDLIERHISIGAPATQWWRSLATVVIFGLTFATVLTLIVTPCALQLRENIRSGWRWLLASKNSRRSALSP